MRLSCNKITLDGAIGETNEGFCDISVNFDICVKFDLSVNFDMYRVCDWLKNLMKPLVICRRSVNRDTNVI